MGRILTTICCLMLLSPMASAHHINKNKGPGLSGFGQTLCKNAAYYCMKIKRGDSWHRLFPNVSEREIVRKVNRMNTRLRSGMTIAVPKNLSSSNFLSLAPFPRKISPQSRNLVKVNLRQLAWGAYDKNGNLVNWGPASGGKNYCADVKRGCRTVAGTYTVYRRQGAGCKSSKYPLPRGGAPMPYCMHFHKGYAMHGSNTVPGYNASHGCVRMFTSDARWLNQTFVKVGSTKVQVTR